MKGLIFTRLETIKIAGKEYPLCFSLGVLEEIDAKFGGLERMSDLLSGDGVSASEQLRVEAELLGIMLNAGHIAAAELGEPAPELPSHRVAHFIGFDDIPAITDKIYAVMGISTERKTEAEPPKNAMAPDNGANALTVSHGPGTPPYAPD